MADKDDKEKDDKPRGSFGQEKATPEPPPPAPAGQTEEADIEVPSTADTKAPTTAEEANTSAWEINTSADEGGPTSRPGPRVGSTSMEGGSTSEDKSTSDKTEGFEVTERSPEVSDATTAPQQAPNNSEEEQVGTTPPATTAGEESGGTPPLVGSPITPMTPDDEVVKNYESGEGDNEDEEEEGEGLEYLKQFDLINEGMTPEQLEAEETEFRAKYALDLEEEEEGQMAELPDEDEYALAEEEMAQPNDQQMKAIIRFLDEDEEGEEEEELAPSQVGSETDKNKILVEQMKNFGSKLKNQFLKTKPKKSRVSESSARSRGSMGDNLDNGDLQLQQEDSSMDIGETEDPNVMVLGPDHPKMARFQRALKEHLDRQIYQSDCEIRNLENELKMKKKDRTDQGSRLYQLQNEILRKSETMEKYEKEMILLRERREQTENRTRELRSLLTQLRSELQKEEEQELSLRESIKTLDFTEHIVREAAEKYEGELKIRQLVTEKLDKMKKKTEAEKRDQDYYLDKVLTHVQHMELINAGIRRQVQAHQEEQEQLNTFINEAVTEIEALQIEKLHLQRAWNETIMVVRSRDDALMAAREALQKTKEELRIREAELRSITRLINKEQEAHEQSVALLRRRRMEERILKNQLQKLAATNEQLKDQLAHLNKVKKAVDLELLRANNAYLRKQKEVHKPRRQIEMLAAEKIQLEDQILAVLHEQSGLNKAASHLQNLIKEARQKTRHMEMEVARVENENSVLAIDVEKLRAELFKKTSMLSELEKRCNAQERILLEQMKDIQQSERVIQKKTGEVEKLNKKLNKLISQQGGVEMGPLEREIEELEKQIALEKEDVNRLQEEWLKRQDDLVRLTLQRDSVIHQNELLRKEVFIMERKRQRLDMEVEKKRCEISKVKKSTEGVRAEITTVNGKLHKDRSNHEQMDKDNILIQNELVALLKDAEMEAIELENDIRELETEKVSLKQQLHEAHEQCLQWEKKVRLAKELKDSLRKEQEGSTSAIRLEIRHMQERYNEIVRVQEKLMADLERSVDRRDRIIQQADLNLKRGNLNPKNTKLNIQRNFAAIKERNRLLIKEASKIEQQVRETMDAIQGLEDKQNGAANEVNKMRETIQMLEEKIAEASILKHKNLVEIVLRQEKFRILESIKFNRYKPSGKTMEEIQKLLEEAEKQCYSLVNLSDEISKEYPEASTHIKLVKASIVHGVI